MNQNRMNGLRVIRYFPQNLENFTKLNLNVIESQTHL